MEVVSVVFNKLSQTGKDVFAATTNLDFDVIGISESRIKKNDHPINSINLKHCSYESCPMESSAGGTLLYISNHLSYKSRSDLCIYKCT